MTDCCSSSDCKTPHPNKRRCPINGLEYAEVSIRTIYHHIKKSWQWNCKGRRYFFCDAPDCDVVYFGEDGSVSVPAILLPKILCSPSNCIFPRACMSANTGLAAIISAPMDLK